MKFPQTIAFRDQTARLYGKSKAYPSYRVAYRAGGKRVIRSFSSYSTAKEHAEAKLRELHRGDQNAALTAAQANEALQAFTTLEDYRRETGRTVSLTRALTDYCDATKSIDVTLQEAIEKYRTTMANVVTIDVAQAVEEFIAAEEPKSLSNNGKRPAMSPRWFYIRNILLRRFSAAFPNTLLSDLTKSHLDVFVAGLEKAKLGPKSRNHHRTTIGTFLRWATAKDYLPRDHQLREATKMKLENEDLGEIEFYTAKEFRALIEAAEGSMRTCIAIQGLAGLRSSEIQRIHWEDVWRIEQNIQISGSIAKGRYRRLVEICDSLGAWLAPYRNCTGLIWNPEARNGEHSRDGAYAQQLAAVGERAGIKGKKNALRHGFVTFAYPIHGEAWTAAQAGHAPAMLHHNYRGLATEKQAKAWFDVRPIEMENAIQVTEDRNSPVNSQRLDDVGIPEGDADQHC